MARVTVTGKNKGDILLFALSTCVWCGKTKKLLDDLGVAYTYEYVDLLTGGERDAAVQELSKWNPSKSFPTLVFNNDKTIVGFREAEIKEALK
ncbi:glutaredoxin family protein [Dehalogenimonas sp. 4OHTPN]|uniref:Glutaredoxin family protein n=1 Tax=Dehalogenimonas sp. 4OHTPN TaxID=3166643 RepID=A0AAU8G9S1_9CHLR